MVQVYERCPFIYLALYLLITKVLRFPFEQGELIEVVGRGQQVIQLFSLFLWYAVNNRRFQPFPLKSERLPDNLFLHKTIAGQDYAILFQEIGQLPEQIYRLAI